MDITKDYYQILGVPFSASSNQIRQAYRVLAMRWHPDMHAGEPSEKVAEAEERFKAINEAYGVLSDASHKEIYDYFYFRHHAETTQSHDATQPSQTQTRAHARTWTYSRAKTNSYSHASQARGQANAESRRRQGQEGQQTGRHHWYSWSWGPDKNNSDSSVSNLESVIIQVAVGIAVFCWALYGILSGKAFENMEPYRPPKPVHKEHVMKSGGKNEKRASGNNERTRTRHTGTY